MWARPCARAAQAIPGGKTKHDQIAAHQIAVLLRGVRLPQASVSPAARRAPRDLLRRRMPLTHNRAALLAYVQQTNSHYNLPESGTHPASQAKRSGVAERFPEPAVQQRIAVDLARLDVYDRLLTDFELSIVTTATQHAANTCSRRAIPGIGKSLRLVWRYAIHDIRRFPRVQAFGDGTSGNKIGHADLPGAFSDAAGLCLRDQAAGQKQRARLEKQHGTGPALTMLAHRLARAVYDMRQREQAFDMAKLIPGSWRGAREPEASLDDKGISLGPALCNPSRWASWHAPARVGFIALSPAPLLGRPLQLLGIRRWSPTAPRVLPLPRT